MTFARFLFRHRSYTPIPFILAALVLAAPTPASLGAGAIVCACGLLLRLWGVVTAGPLVRMQDAPGGDVLVTHGPYAHLRNPLYAGNMILYAGLAVATAVGWLVPVTVGVFALQYQFIVRDEEAYLARTFGARYLAYVRGVRRYLPRLTAYREAGIAAPRLWTGLAPVLRAERRTFQALALAIALILSVAVLR